MPTFDPSDLIGRTFLLPPEENGVRHRAKVTRQVVEIIDQDNGQRVENINFIQYIGNGKVEELISYNQLLEHLEKAQDNDMGMDQELYKFRAIIGHQGPLLALTKSGKQFVNTLEDNIRRRGAMDKLLSDSAKTEISNKIMDILRAYHISNWHPEPYHQIQNPAEWRYRTIKSWTNTVMNRSGAPADCWLLCLICVLPTL